MTVIRGEKQDRASQKFSFPDWTPRQVFTATLVVLMVLAGFWLLYRYRLVAFGMFEAIVFGTAIRPAVSWFERRGCLEQLGLPAFSCWSFWRSPEWCCCSSHF